MADIDAYVIDWDLDDALTSDTVPPAPPAPPEPVGPHDVLVFDMRNPCGPGGGDALGQWYAWTPTGELPRAACLHQGVHHYLDDDGVVRYEVPGVYADDATEQIRRKVHFAPISSANLLGAERIYRVQADGKWYDNTEERATAVIVEEKHADPVTQTEDVTMTDNSLEEYEFHPDPGRATSIEMTFEEQASDYLTRGWAFRALGFEVGIRGRMRKLGAAQQLGDDE
jgi:hypothetical protein